MHKQFLMQAYQLAQERLGFCAPNPSVGCVLVKNNIPIAAAAHQACGQPHAEILALAQAGDDALGAIAYVTLVPCAHTGRTPPCADALVAAGIKAVYYGMADPNTVAQGGVNVLTQSGIICEQISLPEIDAFYGPYRTWVSTGNARLNAKLALSLDGKYGIHHMPVRITGKDLEQQTAVFRSQHDVIVTSIQTIRFDNPRLNVRFNNQIIPKPVIVLDPLAELPLSAQIFKTSAKVIVFHSDLAPIERLNKLRAAGVLLRPMDRTGRRLDPEQLPRLIGQLGYHTAWIEVGGRWLASLLTTKQLYQLYLYMGNTLLGEQAISMPFPRTDWLSHAGDVHWQSVGSETYCSITL